MIWFHCFFFHVLLSFQFLEWKTKKTSKKCWTETYPNQWVEALKMVLGKSAGRQFSSGHRHLVRLLHVFTRGVEKNTHKSWHNWINERTWLVGLVDLGRTRPTNHLLDVPSSIFVDSEFERTHSNNTAGTPDVFPYAPPTCQVQVRTYIHAHGPSIPYDPFLRNRIHMKKHWKT